MSQTDEVNGSELERLNRKEKNHWVLMTVLLTLLSLTVILQYLSSYRLTSIGWNMEDQYRTTLSVGLPGLIILFCLYTTVKRREISSLKSTLYSQQFLVRRLAERTRELESTLDELSKVGDVKDMLLSTVSHELQTPLASIYTVSETLLSYEGDTATTRKFYHLIHEESRRLSDLVRNLLDIAKIGSGTMTWEIRPHRVDRVVRTALAVTGVLARERKIRIIERIENDLPLLAIDRDRMIQVLTNLIGNALKYTPEGGEVEVTVAREADGLRFAVRDTGVGIPADQLCRVFDRFHRAVTPMGTGVKGTGLGLAISKEIVEHFGGRIWAESKPGVGSTFFFTIPLLPGGGRGAGAPDGALPERVPERVS